MKQLCTICVRGGSKGLKNKNIKILNGIPLLAHTIKHAKDSHIFDAIAVSSDSDEMLEIATQHGADYVVKRPGHLATDNAAKIPVIRHCVQDAERQSGISYDVCVDLDATSPLRLPEDIVNAVNIFKEKDSDNLFSVCPAHRSPYFNLVEQDENGNVKLSKGDGLATRQSSPSCYDMNASIYVWKRDVLETEDTLFLNKTDIYIMPTERSFDIDHALDFEIVEFLLSRNENK